MSAKWTDETDYEPLLCEHDWQTLYGGTQQVCAKGCGATRANPHAMWWEELT